MAVAALPAAAACAPGPEVARGDVAPAYLGIETVLLDDDPVTLRVAMQGRRGRGDVDAYSRRAAAQ
jgi:hypothetical protein